MFSRSGITTLRNQALNDILVATGLPTLLRRSPLRAVAYALAGLAFGQYGYLDWIARQSVPFTSTGIYLEAWAALVGITRKAATAATGFAYFVGTVGSVVPAGTVLRRADGASYSTNADCILTGNGTGTVGITCLATGSAYTLTGGTPLALASPAFGVQSGATADPGVAGADPELDAPFRTRMLLRWAQPPQGGSATDYLQWASAVPGVTRTWVLPVGMGPGTVVVYTMWDVAEAAHGGFPQGTGGVAGLETRDVPATGDQLAVADAIFPLRPITALVYSVCPVAFPVAFVIHAPGGVPVALQPAIGAAIDAVFLQLASPLGVEIEAVPFNIAIAAVPGMPPFTLDLPPIVAPVGALPVRGAMTYA